MEPAPTAGMAGRWPCNGLSPNVFQAIGGARGQDRSARMRADVVEQVRNGLLDSTPQKKPWFAREGGLLTAQSVLSSGPEACGRAHAYQRPALFNRCLPVCKGVLTLLVQTKIFF